MCVRMRVLCGGGEGEIRTFETRVFFSLRRDSWLRGRYFSSGGHRGSRIAGRDRVRGVPVLQK